MKRQGYTLVELLVVVAIVAIIAAMLLPVLLQAKETARLRMCSSNMRQLGSAILRYMDDHNGYGLPAPPQSFRNPWILCVKPLLPQYIPVTVRSTDIAPSGPYPYQDAGIGAEERPSWLWRCSGDSNRGSGDTEHPAWWVLGSSYRYPGPTVFLSGERVMQRTGTYPRRPLSWKSHKRDIFLADHYDDFHNGTRADRKMGDPSLLSSTWVKVKSVNVLFLDMHLRAMTADDRYYYQKEYLMTRDNPYYKPEPK